MEDKWTVEKLDQFYTEFTTHMKSYDEYRRQEVIEHLELKKAIEDLTKSTSNLVEAWDNGQSVLKVGALLGRFAKWLTTLAVLGAAFKWLFDRV